MVIDYKTKIPDVPENVLRYLFGEFKPKNPTYTVGFAAYCEMVRINNALDYMNDFMDEDRIKEIKNTLDKHGMLGAVYAEFAFDKDGNYFPISYPYGIDAVSNEFKSRIDPMEWEKEEN